MVAKEVIINKVVEFIDSKLSVLSSNNPIVLIFRPVIARAINNNIGKLDSILKLIQDDKGMIDVEGIMDEMVNNLLVSKVKQYPDILGGIDVGAGTIKVNIPYINKSLVFDTEDFESFKQSLINK